MVLSRPENVQLLLREDEQHSGRRPLFDNDVGCILYWMQVGNVANEQTCKGILSLHGDVLHKSRS